MPMPRVLGGGAFLYERGTIVGFERGTAGGQFANHHVLP